MRLPISGTSIRVLSAAALMCVLASVPSVSQTAKTKADDRVELIMDGLPAAGSPEYKALLKHAGSAIGQVLPLTKTEMWSIPRNRLSGLQRAADAKNVTVTLLDEGWNQVFRQPPAGKAMDDKTKSMRDMAMQSPATGSVGMMSTRSAGVVEYALTKGIGDKVASQRKPMRIKIGINATTEVTAVRSNVVIAGDRCIWRGVIEGTTNPVTIMWWGSGRITGTIHHDKRIYQIKQFSDDTIGIVESMSHMLPDEHARTSPRRMEEMKMKDDLPFMHGDSGSMRPRPKRSDVDDAKDALDSAPGKTVRAAVVAPKPSAKVVRKSATKGLPALPQSTIDVMVVYTAKAARNYSDIVRDLIDLSIEETNQSFRNSKIDNVTVRLVHTYQTDYVEDGAEHFDHVWRMVDRDGFMDDVPRLRNEKKADVVILVVDDGSGCGLATRVAPEADEAYAVVHHECAATSYSLAHEIGHIIGTRHDRSLDQNMHPFPNGHGFVSPDLKWRTMMSYKAGCNGCPRLPIWSTPDNVVEGKPAGDPLHNNAAVIRENADRVAAFR